MNVLTADAFPIWLPLGAVAAIEESIMAEKARIVTGYPLPTSNDEGSCRGARSRMKNSASPKWTEDEIAILRNNRLNRCYGLLPHRTKFSIWRIRNRLGITNKSRHSDAVWSDIARRIAAGESVLSVSNRFKIHREMIAKRFARDQKLAKAAGWQPKTVINQHLAAKIVEAVNAGERLQDVLRRPGFPSRSTVLLWRAYDADFEAHMHAAVWLQNKRKFEPDRVRFLLSEIASGKSICSLTRKSGSRIIDSKTFYSWKNDIPNFSKAVDLAMARAAKACTSKNLAPVRPARRNDPTEIMTMIRAAVPTVLPNDIRDDIISAMLLAVYEGKLLPSDIQRRYREFVTAHYRQFSKFGPASLDAPVYQDNATPLIETIRSDQALWGGS